MPQFQTTKWILCVSLMCLNTYQAAEYGFQILFTCFSTFVWTSFLFQFRLNFHDGSRSIQLSANGKLRLVFNFSFTCGCTAILALSWRSIQFNFYILCTLSFHFISLRFFTPVFFYFVLLFTFIVQKYSNFFEINSE